MQYWQKNRNYRKRKNADGSFTYIIKIEGVEIEVSMKIYKAYSRADRRERYCAERDAGLLLSLERFEEDDVQLSCLTDCHVESAEDTAIRHILIEQAMAILRTLDAEDQRLLRALVMDGVTEKEYAARIGLSQKGVNKRKHRALEKIRKILVLKP